MSAGATIADARRSLARAFRDAGLDSPELDARVLVGHALGLDHTALVVGEERVLTAEEKRSIDTLAARRLAHEPVALIVGLKEFWGLPFAVNRATLIPRPETETVVEAALSFVDARGSRTRPLRIADLGVGSGAILLALLSELAAAVGIGVDISTPAIAVARENARRLGLADRAAFAAGDFASALGTAFDLVLSNPPYISGTDLHLLSPEISDFEPASALFGGADGLAAYRAIARDARRVLKPDGAIVLEIGQGQAEAVTGIFAKAGFAPLGAPRPDLAGIPRALILTAI